MKRKREQFVGRWTAIGLVVLLGMCGVVLGQEDRTFRLNNVEVRLADVSAEADVYFRSMRLNRALDVWNVEVTVSNKVERVISGPLVLLVEGFTNTTGPQGTDGTIDGSLGFYDLSGLASNGALAPGAVTAPRTLTLGRSGSGSPNLQTRVYAGRPQVSVALGVTRSLNEAGQPLPRVGLSIAGPAGTASQETDSDNGVASFGQGPGEHVVKFAADGYLPVWRRQALVVDETTLVPNPRLTRRELLPVQVTPLGGTTVTNAAGTIAVQFDAGAVAQATEVTLTPLTAQSLPGFLPLGWSPMNAFWIESPVAIGDGARAVLRPASAIGSGETAALVKWNETALEWIVTGVTPGNGTNRLTMEIEGAGAYALVVGDNGPTAPPAAQIGSTLGGFEPGPELDLGQLSAEGSVTPPGSPASVVPELVTGTAELELRHESEALPSGYLLRGEVTETYLLSDGSIRLTPQYEHYVVGYQRPGDQDPFTLHADFPMRPVLLFGSEELSEATVRVDVLPEQPFDGAVLDQSGGQISVGGVRLLAGNGQLRGPSAVRLRRLDATVFTNLVRQGQVVLAAFDLTVDSSTLKETLSAQLGGVPAGERFVLARVLSDTGYFGLQPVERLESDVQGNLVSLEPTTGERLPGLRSSGQFVLVQVNEVQGLVGGVARNGQGEIQGGMPVQLVGLPWLTLSDEQGRFQLVAPMGAQELGVTDPVTGDTGFVSITVVDPGVPLAQDLGTAPSGPRVARITPADGARRVPRVGSVVIEFNEAINPGSVVGGIELVKPDQSVVAAALTLNLAGTIATLSPAVELEANMEYRVRLAGTIADPGGLPIEGATEFTFTTVGLSARDPAAQLIIYEPGATNVPPAVLNQIPAYEPGEDPFAIVVRGTPGVADPEVPVILVNESTGETATVLSKVDGSFASVISGTEEDFVSATFVNLNGTRVYVPVSRQEFDDGFVGLYPQGGILEAESDGGPVQVYIEPQAIETKAILRLVPMSAAALARELDGTTPEVAQIAGGALVLETEGPPPAGGFSVSLPVDLAALNFPTNVAPDRAAMALTLVREVEGVKAFEHVAPMTFVPASPNPAALSRMGGPRPQDDGDEFLYYGTAESALGFLPVGGIATMAFRYVLVPMLIGHEPMVVKGKTVVLDLDLEANPTGEIGADLAAGVVTGTTYEEIRAIRDGRPLPGAYVVLHDPLAPFGPPGRLRPGVVYATSSRDGSYLLTVPVGGYGYIITATHPRFQDRPALPVVPLFEISLAGAVFKYLVFKEPLAHQVPPQLLAAHTPLLPAPGEICQLHVTAAQGLSAVPEITLRVVEATPLAGGVEGSVEDVQLDIVAEEVIAGNRKRVIANIATTNALQVRIRITTFGSAGGGTRSVDYPITFGGAPKPDVEDGIPPSDPTEDLGPLVLATFPSDGGALDAAGQLRIIFNEPIDKLVERDLEGITLTGPGAEIPPHVELDDSQRELRIRYGSLAPDTEYLLTLAGTTIRDLNGNPLDQKPSTSIPDGFTLRFRTMPVETTALSEISNGAGVVISGTRLYALDRSDNALVIIDLRDPQSPRFLNRIRVRGAPRDLAVIPHYSYKTRDRADTVVTGELVAVVSGDLGSRIDDLGNVIVPGQQLVLYDVTDAAAPRLLASPLLTLRDATVIRKIRWDAPYLSYLEFGADLQAIGFINLQEMVWGFSATLQQAADFPAQGRPGEDNNHDGDFVDEGDVLPIPARQPLEFFGKTFSQVLFDTTQKIQDYASVGIGLVGVTLNRGFRVDPNGEISNLPIRPAYRTLMFNGFEVGAEAGTIQFGTNAHPKRVAIFDGVPIVVSNQLTTPIIAVVSLSPDGDGAEKLAVIDITLPESPQLLNTIPFPESLIGGSLNSMIRTDVGTIELATARNVFLLDTRRLADPVPDDGLHPSLMRVIPGAGSSTMSYGSSGYGLHAVSEGGRNVLVQSGPVLEFVSFPSLEVVVNPRELPESRTELDDLYARRSPAESLFPARFRENEELEIASDLSPPSPSAHYHVLLHALGGAGESIQIGLETLTMAGEPRSNLGLLFPPVRAVSESTTDALGQRPRPECDALIGPLTAYRMSDDPLSPYFNRYLSKPFAVIYESIHPTELDALKVELDREILWNGAYMRAFIDPAETVNPQIGRFAASVDEELNCVRPLVMITAPMLDLAYVMGNNPPPLGGTETMPGTFGMVAGHSGEVRCEGVDIALPSRRMPVVIERAIGGQDRYEGPFGLGWDFNYNQRIVELGPAVFPAGLEMPLVVRASVEESVIGSSMDLLFHSGAGRLVHFRHVGTNPPPEYAADPLVEELEWEDRVGQYYLPESSVFDLLVRFKDGYYERLTPEGTRFRYNAGGRLESIIDRFPLNRHELEYDAQGWLRRIDDRSVDADRFVEFGHYRRGNDPEFVRDLDERTDNAFLVGKICRLRDYAGTDVLFFYDDFGQLIRREGPMLGGENGGFAGRSQTHYIYEQCRFKGVALGQAGDPFFAAATTENSKRQHLAESGEGIGGQVNLNVPPETTAADLDGLTTSAQRQDNSIVEYRVDQRGHVTSTRLSSDEGTVDTDQESNEHGQVTFLRMPEGNTQTFVYDTNNPVFRSRGNLLRVTYGPGPRGGESYTTTFSYDARYNLPSGGQTTPNDYQHTYTLTSDGRAVSSIALGSAGTETMDYNEYGQIIATVGVNGVESRTDYDPTTGFIEASWRGPHAFRKVYDGGHASRLGLPASVEPPSGLPTALKYNANLQTVESQRGELVVQLSYDDQGRVVKKRQVVGGGVEKIDHTVYDRKGFVVETRTEGLEVDGVPSTVTYRYVPDDLARVQSIFHPNEMVQTFRYNGRGNLIQMTFGDYVEDYDVDLHGNVTEVRKGGEIVAMTEYDGFDRPKRVTRPGANGDEIEESAYFRGGELRDYTLTDPRFGVVRRHTHTEVDALGRTLQMTIHGDHISPSYTYRHEPLQNTQIGPRLTSTMTWDRAGYNTGYQDPILTTRITPTPTGLASQIVREEQGRTFTSEFDHDEVDNIRRVSDDLGPRFTYDARADGSIVSITNAAGHATLLEHTALGELTRKSRADGVEFRYRRDAHRNVTYTGDPTAGFGFVYDDNYRLQSQTLRNGGTIVYGDFDARNLPRSITLPGGSMDMEYDRQGRLTRQSVTYRGTTYEAGFVHDALNRIREQTIDTGGSTGTTRIEYDPAGVLTSIQTDVGGSERTVGFGYYSDGTSRSTEYPSGISVTEDRDATGRLLGVSDASGNIIRALTWEGNLNPKTVTLGSRITIVNQYDARGRLAASRARREGDNAVLAHMRYLFDGADNITTRQFLHRGGRADVFGYDAGERLVRAQVGGFPRESDSLVNPLYERGYGYDPTGLDYLVTAPVSSTFSPAVPSFASSWGAHDAFLQPVLVDGFDRGPADPLGNVSRLLLQTRPESGEVPMPVPATLDHNGLGALVRVNREDGVVVENEFQPEGLRFQRRVIDSGTVIDHRHFVYDGEGRLIEEYDQLTGSGRLIGRYYYASGDAPVAADLYQASSGQLQRFYYLRDLSMSVIAVVSEDGTVVERVWYDPHGQPVIEQQDSRPPAIRRVEAVSGGRLRIILSEPVTAAAADPGNGIGLVFVASELEAGVTVTSGSPAAEVPGDVTWVEVPGHPPGSVIEFAAAAALSGQTTLRLEAGALADEWGNVNSENTLVFEHPAGAEGVLLDVTPAPQTAPVRTSTSSIGNPFLFHGQYFDYPTGLVYKRARFYDPYSGMFLEPDPLGYEDSVNLYAGLQNNPVSMRDPTGLSVLGLFGRANRSFLGKSGLTDLEIQAIANVLARRQESISISIRKFAKYDKNAGRWIDDIDTAGSRRALSEKGLAGKSAGASRTGVKVKNDAYARGTQIEDRAFRVGFGKYKITLFKYQKKIPITSDLDALHVTIDGQFASVKQIRELFGEINREYVKLHKQHFAHMGKKAPKPNPPFQHEAHAHLLHQMGNKVGTRVGKAGYVTIKDIEAIGHPNDAFVITSKKFNNGGTAFEARDLSRDEITGILQRGLDDFLENKQSLIDEKLALGRLTPDQLKDSGLFDTVRWPGSYDTFVDGTPSLGGLR